MKTDRVAIVTGAGRGIGKACAVGLSKSGYRIVLAARTESQLQEVAHEIERQGGKNEPIVYPLDITDPENVWRFVSDIVDRTGRIDVLVNNAGITMNGTLSVSLSDLDRVLHTNLRGPFSLLKAVVPIMKKQKSGSIFNIASRLGKVGFAEKGVYCASKFALVGLNESLYRELSPEGISVTAICPAWVHTDMAQQGGTPLSFDEMIQPEDIMRTIQWLLSLSPGTCVKEVVIECRKSMA